MPDQQTFPILVVDDEEEILFTTSITLRSAGFPLVLTESDSRNVMEILARQEVALVLLDLYMPHLPGYELLKEITANHPEIPVIVVTAANEVGMAVECMKAGAFDYFVKPVEPPRLLATVRKALEMHALRSQVNSLSSHILTGGLDNEEAFAPIITRNRKMHSIFQYLEAIAPSNQPLLVTGETGVGKELVARTVHNISGRKGPFVAVNIAGLDDMVFSDTLFGHRKGAFTGADRQREGLIAKAAGGTLFLDEIGDLQPSSQVKLLRLLQEQEYYPLGADTPVRADARIVVATNRDLKAMMADGSFRKDLYYRLSAHQVLIPPLRDRREDIPLLVEHFFDEAAASLSRQKPTIPPELTCYLGTYAFPGNIRELRAMVFDAMARHEKGVLSLAAFREVIGNPRSPAETSPLPFLKGLREESGNAGRMPTLKEAEDALIAHALSIANGNQGIASAHLGITRQALNKRLNRRTADE
ncbi:sigma-54 dependent transcriptional regulator [Geobacter hydrogenophilus]|uniref:Sigma-54-dependent Fis family transcriptional regulator n=1 Tax=Geobacter hydrogenophilus TaxID=40983 RepID=A0A9W6FY33_9BACT|nr:sigma-54 dependent transcriptional regulator [Geobacter hydrogenophilus]MBT0895126.1 sigma-54 dependent transcriptional regulator [Geobacter hydrogenophilus]GLI36952.1 sigma-54-dependent Fis family transcriptional regulator [Geobacter hydrogenophilus]